MADWAELPPELLLKVSKQLTINIDYIRFRSVCLSWRCATAKRPLHLPCQSPLLMRPHEVNSDLQGFFSLSSNNTFHVKLPETRGKRCCGSSGGWLILLDKTPAICLFNPLTKAQIQLPPLTTFPDVVDYQPSRRGKEYIVRNRLGEDDDRYTSTGMRDYFISKAVLSCSPYSGVDCIVMVVLALSCKLAFCRPGDETWTIMDTDECYYDVVYYKRQFYSMDTESRVVICNITPPEVVIIMDIPIWPGGMNYLVESAGELLLVIRDCDEEKYVNHRTCKFDVFKIDMHGPVKTSRVKSLGERALFLGQNHSISVSATDFPGCKGNHIYFTDNYFDLHKHGHEGGHDLGVFNLEDESIEQVPCYPPKPVLIWPPPVWFTPSLF